jgi:ribonuclease J
MINWLRPQVVIPVHGERLMLDAQAALATSIGIKQTIVPNNGAVIRLAPDTPAVVDHVKTGLLAVEPQRIVRADHRGLSERRKLQFTGAAHVTVALSPRGDLLMDPSVTLMGLIDEDDAGELDIVGDVRQEIEDTLLDLKEEGVNDTARIEEDVRVAVRRLLNQIFGFKPKVSVHLIRV